MSWLGRILIADDEATFLPLDADLLARRGYECWHRPDAKAAPRCSNRNRIDLLHCGHQMRGIPILE